MQIVALVALVSAAALALAFGARYVLTKTFMPYHAAVLGKPWPGLEPRLQFARRSEHGGPRAGDLDTGGSDFRRIGHLSFRADCIAHRNKP